MSLFISQPNPSSYYPKRKYSLEEPSHFVRQEDSLTEIKSVSPKKAYKEGVRYSFVNVHSVNKESKCENKDSEEVSKVLKFHQYVGKTSSKGIEKKRPLSSNEEKTVPKIYRRSKYVQIPEKAVSTELKICNLKLTACNEQIKKLHERLKQQEIANQKLWILAKEAHEENLELTVALMRERFMHQQSLNTLFQDHTNLTEEILSPVTDQSKLT